MEPGTGFFLTQYRITYRMRGGAAVWEGPISISMGGPDSLDTISQRHVLSAELLLHSVPVGTGRVTLATGSTQTAAFRRTSSSSPREAAASSGSQSIPACGTAPGIPRGTRGSGDQRLVHQPRRPPHTAVCRDLRPSSARRAPERAKPALLRPASLQPEVRTD